VDRVLKRAITINQTALKIPCREQLTAMSAEIMKERWIDSSKAV
jgi:hypothetical protein